MNNPKWILGRVRAPNNFNIESAEGKYVLYWMQAAQRTYGNQALAWAQHNCKLLNLPLLVVFCLQTGYPYANTRNMRFMLEGLADIKDDLYKQGIGFVVVPSGTDNRFYRLQQQAALLISDYGYSRFVRSWHRQVQENSKKPWQLIETEVSVPVMAVAQKQAFNAAYIRRRLLPLLADYATLPQDTFEHPRWDSSLIDVDGVEVDNADEILTSLHLPYMLPVTGVKGGQEQALAVLKAFIAAGLPKYNEHRNNPEYDVCSHLSPYLHFGQISVLTIWHTVKNLPYAQDFIEQLLVRRELAINYQFYNQNYDNEAGLPQWGIEAMLTRKPLASYTMQQLEDAETEDPYWNAAQRQLVKTGVIHSYMRMYWGKQVVSWSHTAAQAQAILLHLNDKWALDGRDANGYAGVNWCLGLHDRPFPVRLGFGRLRSMTKSGLLKKFNTSKYLL